MSDTSDSVTLSQDLLWTVKTFASLSSTSDYAKSMCAARKDTLHGLVIRAGIQTHGRGQRGRSWVSYQGNLHQSCVLTPDISPKSGFALAFLAANSVACLIEACLIEEGVPNQSVRVKWPNDVLLNGAKVAGLLIESGIQKDQGLRWYILGMGVNLKTAPSLEQKTTCLADYGVTVDSDLFGDQLLASLAQGYTVWRRNGFASVRDEWLTRAAHLNQQVCVGGRVGIFRDLAMTGALLLETQAGDLIPVTSGDIGLMC